MSVIDLEARGGGGRGGGGGGRGGGGGGGRGGGSAARSVQRSPSMSRAAPRPASVSRPNVNRPVTVNRPEINTRPAVNRPDANRDISRARNEGQTRNQVQQFMKDRPNTAQERRNTGDLRQNINNDRFQNIGREARNNINSNYRNRNDWFNRNFWDRNDLRPPYYNNTGNWWRAATAAGVGSWLGWRGSPYYYGYDDFGYYGGGWDQGYSDSSYTQPTQTTQPTYSEQSQAIETASSSSNTGSNQWMPLGVFSVVKNSESTATPNMFVQLALNKSGAISGTFYNATTDKAYELEGWVDSESQRAAWKIADNSSSPIIETGIYNLTKDEAPVRIYFPNGSSQDRLLVRVES